jgi:aminoglycoside phosphotransferase (APT) family kinase protein
MNGRLAAVIDFGCAAAGDPACDLVMAWTFFSHESRDAFRSGLDFDDTTWTRARGWALWKALATLAHDKQGGQHANVAARRMGWRWGATDVITALLADARTST